ncbi:MAG: fibro-slime domain-containing protein [Myxococcota bacterium]|nr:fibro-slime domain-containing protein [Myxococcota bacterium]
MRREFEKRPSLRSPKHFPLQQQSSTLDGAATSERAAATVTGAYLVGLGLLVGACGSSGDRGEGATAPGSDPASSGTIIADGGGSLPLPIGGDAAGSSLFAADAAGSSLFAGDASAPMFSSLTVTVRDFKFWAPADPTTNPDFENVLGDDHGAIVASVLGADHKPIYKNTAGTTATTHGKKYFDQWYNDSPATNVAVQYPLTLTKSAQGTYGYDSQVSGVPFSPGDPRKMWFPIDDGTPYSTRLGNQGRPHNYSFTTELHTVFVYAGGETFSFSGDDDVFVFIDGKLVIDLGGVHSKEQALVQLDSLGLVRGQQYSLDLFNAERHTDESNLSFTTTLRLQPPPK